MLIELSRNGADRRTLFMKTTELCKKVLFFMAAAVILSVIGAIQEKPGASAAGGDVAGPVVVSLTFSPTTIDISNSSASVVFTARVTDTSGVNALPPVYVHHPENFSATYRTATFVRTSGTAQDGIYSATITIPRGKQPGEWVVFSHPFGDTQGNQSLWGYPDNNQKLTVVNNSVGDITGPVIVSSTSTVPVTPPTTTTITTALPTIATSIPPATNYVAPPAITNLADKPNLTTKKLLSAKSLATYTDLKNVRGSTVSIGVYATSRKICQISGTNLKAIKKGACRIVVTVKSRTGRKSSRSLTLLVRS